jgi:alkylhydroperoxidase/carboxymuconolactone decarboxylase family protein YurZ
MDSLETARQFEVVLNDLPPGPDRAQRALALVAAAVATGDDTIISSVASRLRTFSIPRDEVYEIILQSYLFLGFPRMLIAAESLAASWPEITDSVVARPAESGPKQSPPDSAQEEQCTHWKVRGAELYNRVYGRNANRLKERVMSIAPEIFEWMITEGYGKVLSRPGLGIITRELAVIAFLTVDNRPKQLLSHLKGALLVGAEFRQLENTIDDLSVIAPEGADVARTLLTQLGGVQ